MVERGDQQVEGKSLTQSDLYAPVLKEQEALLLFAVAAKEGYPVWKTEISQAFLSESMGEDVVYTVHHGL